MADRRALATARTRIVLGLLLAFGVTGLLLSSVGLYGTVAYSAIRRMREMGLRLALGAAKGDVLRLMLKQPALHVLLGAVLGVTAALVLTRHVDALLYEVDPGDPRILALATATLLLVVLVAAWIPAIRATRVDPATSLREN
jgi:ABC-type antimicrobial peptide transport system permease subunit